MILNDVKNYIKDRGQVSLQDISLHFDVEPEALQGMLEFWVNKGRIRKQIQTACGSGACNCEFKNEQMMYLWNAQFDSISIEIKH
jgi:hypothetical protein